MTRIHYLNVNQGNTALIELPNNQFMLIDCNQVDDGTDILSYIKDIISKEDGKYHVDYVVLTHPHKDHIRGLEDIINDEEITIGEIWESGHRTRDDDEEYKKYVNIMNRDDLDVIKVKASSSPFREFDNVKIHIFAPSKYITEDDEDDPRKAIHNRCMVMKLEYNNKSVLFTGDSSYECWENRIVPNYSDDNEDLNENLLSADVLTVSHHGSRTFFMEKEGDKAYKKGIKKISPTVCAVSVGLDNEHNHPHREAMKIYKKESDDIFVTKDDGTFIVDLETLGVEVHHGESDEDSDKEINGIPQVDVSYSDLDLNSKPNNYKKIYNSNSRKDIGVKKGGSLRFELLNPIQGYEYRWIVENSGRAVWLDYFKAKDKTHLVNESSGISTQRDLRWRGRHKVTCRAIVKGKIMKQTIIKVRIM